MGHVLLIIILMCLSIIASPSSGAKSQKNVWSPKIWIAGNKLLFYKTDHKFDTLFYPIPLEGGRGLGSINAP